MNTLLKRLSGLVTILFLLTLCGCGAIPATDAKPESSPSNQLSASSSSGSAISSKPTPDPSATMDPERRKQVRLEIDSDSQNKIQIPDPAKNTEDVVKISLQTEAEDDVWDYETEEDYVCNCQNRYGADLSFAGLEPDVMVSSYVVGNMTDPDSNIKNCLALFVHENPETEQKKDYFLVLDYGQGSYYLTETAFFLHSWSQWVDLESRDLTGDGIQELIVSHIYNKSIDVGVFRCDKQHHTMFPLFSTLDDFAQETGDFLDQSWFQGHLEDDYKVVLEFPEINYSKTVSMIDEGGYSIKELQVGTEDRYGGINFVALWKDGKLQKKKVDSDTVFLYTLDHVDYPIGKSGKPQLELVRGIFVGHRSERIGNMHIFLQYDSAQDRLTLKKANYVDVKQAEKEWETFEEWAEE